MSDSRKLGYKLMASVFGIALVFALLGCPPPKPATAPSGEPQVSQHTLDSLRADSLKRCRAHRSFAFQYARSDLRSDAITQFEKALAYCEDDADLERYYAGYLDKWGMKDSAFVHYRRAGEMDTTLVRTHFWLYSHYHDTGEYDKAIKELLMAARHQEDRDTQILWFKTAADMMVAQNEQAAACELYTYLQGVVPGDADVAEKMLNCVGDNPEARLAALRSACSADTTNRTICDMFAQESEKAGDDASALAVYSRAARLDSNDIASWEAVIRTARRLNAQDTVLNALDQLARLEPDNPERAAAFVDELFARGRMKEGFAVLMPKVRDFPKNAHLLYLAGLYYSRGNSDSDKRTALEYLDRAVIANDPAWKSQALSLHDSIEPPLTEDEINQAKFFGKKIKRLHRCRIPGREKQNEVLGN